MVIEMVEDKVKRIGQPREQEQDPEALKCRHNLVEVHRVVSQAVTQSLAGGEGSPGLEKVKSATCKCGALMFVNFNLVQFTTNDSRVGSATVCQCYNCGFHKTFDDGYTKLKAEIYREE